MLDFKNDLNKLFQKNSDELLTKFLSISALPKDCYLRMQTSTLCEYDKDHVYFIHTNEEFRIKSFFELIKSFYSLRGVNEHFSKAFSTKTLEFLSNIPDNFTETVFLKYQEELYLKYWEDISPDKYNFFKVLRTRYSEKISAEAYTEFLYFFLKDDFELKKQKNFDKFINKINANMYLALNIKKNIR
ncbi:hypothetical protein [Acinetobacter haemolyticus]|uniref:hypothetical protein n=1 Tax=Acinetobacter haemolyticus TaxID=29430 RepID=UPI000D69E070|nr:hypothetical protein [Acinetobacter haemolyticus]